MIRILLIAAGLALVSANRVSYRAQLAHDYNNDIEASGPIVTAINLNDGDYNTATKIIQFYLDPTLSANEMALVRKAYQQWGISCINLTELSTTAGVTANKYLRIKPGSPNGVFTKTNTNARSLTFSEAGNFGDFLYALGLFGFNLPVEFQRTDRDDFITINPDIDISADPYDIKPSNPTKFGFDYDSVMLFDNLYNGDGYSGYLYQTPDKRDMYTVGQSNYVSFLDRKKANDFYGCRTCSGDPCQNDGYAMTAPCTTCICPPGLTGATCTERAPSVGMTCGGDVVVSPCHSQIIELGAYPAGAQCTWKVTTSAGSGLVFAFEKRPELPVNPFRATCGDAVFIREFGKGKYPGKKFCSGGVTSGRIFETDDTEALVHFESVLNQARTYGFKLVAYATCPGTLPKDLTKECVITSTGYDFIGSLNTALSGAPCLNWPPTSPAYLYPFFFPEGSLSLSNQRCRNPDSESWLKCYTSPSTTEQCSLAPLCQGNYIRCVRTDNLQYQGCRKSPDPGCAAGQFQLGGFFTKQRCEIGVAVRCFNPTTKVTRCVNHNMQCNAGEIEYKRRFNNFIYFGRNYVDCINYRPKQDHVRCVKAGTEEVVDCRKISLGCHPGEEMKTPAYTSVKKCYARLQGPLNTPF